MTPPAHDERLLRTRRWALALGSLSVSLALVVGLLLAERGGRVRLPSSSVAAPAAAPQPDGEQRRAAVDAMVAAARGIMDQHPDPDVGRVLLPRLNNVEHHGDLISTNDDGMRQAPVARPKPEGLLRVVLLGDSYLFGWGVSAHERVGHALEQQLRQRLPERELEVLSFAVPSWNLRAQTHWYRRQADLVQADLVFVHVCTNDLDDSVEARGFGAMASTTSQQRGRADALVYRSYPKVVLGARDVSPILLGFDAFSRGRWARAADDVRRLAEAVSAGGGRTVLLLNVERFGSVVREQLVEPLGLPAVWIPARFAGDPQFRLSDLDPHWTAEGGKRVAQLLYGSLRELDLLPGVALPEWPVATQAWRQLHELGAAQAARPTDTAELLRLVGLVPELAPRADGGWPGASQVYGGLDARGRLGPFAACVLPVAGRRELVLELAGLGRPGLPRVTLSVRVDEFEVGELQLGPDDVERRRFALPAAVAERDALTVRLDADDWLYAEDDLRHCVSARLVRVAVE